MKRIGIHHALRHCSYCQRPLAVNGGKLRQATKDHVVPKSLGGRIKVLACFHCNQLKGNLEPDQWGRAMRRFPGWWNRFRTHGELRSVMQEPRWPTDVRVPPRPLCRGLV